MGVLVGKEPFSFWIIMRYLSKNKIEKMNEQEDIAKFYTLAYCREELEVFEIVDKLLDSFDWMRSDYISYHPDPNSNRNVLFAVDLENRPIKILDA
jgi:hypothetical protein